MMTILSFRDLGFSIRLAATEPYRISTNARNNETKLQITENVLDSEPVDFDTYLLEYATMDESGAIFERQKVWIALFLAISDLPLALVGVVVRREKLSSKKHLPT